MTQPAVREWFSLSRVCVLIALILAVLAAFGVGPGFAWSWVAFLASFLV
jgi:hypothetical protein